MNRNVLALALFATLGYSVSGSAASVEWSFHKTVSGDHPNGMEQSQLLIINRARANPAAEGVWLATSTDPDITDGRDTTFNVNKTALMTQFNAITNTPPAAFDVRLYQGALNWNSNLISRNAQDHFHDANGNNQFDNGEASQVAMSSAAGFSYTQFRGNVYSYARNSLYAHAAFNIDWGNDAAMGAAADGMQDPPGHRMAIMSTDGEYSNVGIAMTEETNPATAVGDYVITQNFAKANSLAVDHYNAFIVGTVYEDLNGNGRYDNGEGLSGVMVNPDIGAYYAVTSAGGGYAIPITTTGAASITFSGGGLAEAEVKEMTLGTRSILLDHELSGTVPRMSGSGLEDLFMQPRSLYRGGYGRGFGSNRNVSSFTAEFEQQDEDLLFYVQGYDVDTNRDLRILLNGGLLGYMPRSASRGHSRYMTWSIPKGRQIAGLNTIEVQSLRGGVWGVSKLRILPVTGPTIAMSEGVLERNYHGFLYGDNQHRTVVRTELTGVSGTRPVRLLANSYNNTWTAKVFVYVNGNYLGRTRVGHANRVTRTVMNIPDTVLTSGTNVIEFRHNLPYGTPWAIGAIRFDEYP